MFASEFICSRSNPGANWRNVGCRVVPPFHVQVQVPIAQAIALHLVDRHGGVLGCDRGRLRDHGGGRELGEEVRCEVGLGLGGGERAAAVVEEMDEPRELVGGGRVGGRRRQSRGDVQRRGALDDHLDARGDSSAGPLRILLRTTRDGAIDGLLVEPYADLDLEELLRTIPMLAPRATLLSAELVDDGCRPLHAVDADVNLSLASISKLYVLLAVVDAILAGEHSWDEPITIRDALRGEPSRILGTHPEGATLPLRDVLHALIGASDNAANDHLIDLVGRRAVEAAVRASGHHDPALNQPYLTFREFRRLWRLHPSVTDRYLALDEQARRDFLERVLDDLTAPIDERRNLDTIGIFASSTDVCRLLATLAQRARRPEAAPLLEILADGAKLGPSDLAGDDWTFVGGKSGGLGVLGFNDVSSRAVLLRRADDRWFVVVLGLESAGRWTSFARRPIHAVTARIFDLLAREGRP